MRLSKWQNLHFQVNNSFKWAQKCLDFTKVKTRTCSTLTMMKHYKRKNKDILKQEKLKQRHLLGTLEVRAVKDLEETKSPAQLGEFSILSDCSHTSKRVERGRGEGGEGRWESGHNYIYFMTDCECVNVHGSVGRKRERNWAQEGRSQTKMSRKTKGKKKERAAKRFLGKRKERARDVCSKCISKILFEIWQN